MSSSRAPEVRNISRCLSRLPYGVTSVGPGPDLWDGGSFGVPHLLILEAALANATAMAMLPQNLIPPFVRSTPPW